MQYNVKLYQIITELESLCSQLGSMAKVLNSGDPEKGQFPVYTETGECLNNADLNALCSEKLCAAAGHVQEAIRCCGDAVYDHLELQPVPVIMQPQAPQALEPEALPNEN